MNVIGCLWCGLGLISVISTIAAINLQNQQKDQLIYDSLVSEDSTRTKKPFCNAFTGCGKKRSYTENSAEKEERSPNSIRIPVPIYRALLRAASREIRGTLDLGSGGKKADYGDYSYSDVFNKIPHRGDYQS